MFFLTSDMGAQVKNSTTPKLSRAFYDDDDEPLSTFYAPWWKKIHTANYFKSFPPIATGSFRADGDTGAELEDNAKLDIKVGQVWYEGMLRIRIGPDELIGRNLFALDDPNADAKVRRERQNLQALTNLYPTPVYDDIPGIANEPMFLCVASNKWVIGNTWVPDCASDPFMTETNKSSISCVLVWKNNSYISLYTAGDAHDNLESAIAGWLGYTANDMTKQISVLKSSHHGSAHSTPYEFWKQMKPKYCMAMSGTNARHAHPRWEFLHNLHTWYKYADGQDRFKGLYLTNWLSYIGNKRTKNIWDSDYATMVAAEKIYNYCDLAWKAKKARDNVDPPKTLFYEKVESAIDENGHSILKNRDTMWDIVMESLSSSVVPDLMDRSIIELWDFPKRDYVVFDMPRPDDNVMTVAVRSQNSELAQADLAEAKDHVYQPKKKKKRRRNRKYFLTTTTHSASNEGEQDWDIIHDDDEDEFDWGRRDLPQSRVDDRPEPQNQHYVVCEGDKYAPKDPDMQSIIPRTHPLWFLIKFTYNQYLVLNSRPDSSANDLRVQLADDDELQWWLRESLLAGSTEKSVTADVFFRTTQWPPTETMQCDFDLQANYVLSDGTEVTMACETQKAPMALGVEREDIDVMTRGVRIMALGVTVTSTVSTLSLKQVAELVGFSNSKAIKALGSLPLVPVDNGSGGRSALWFASGTRYDTNLRLEFQVPDSSKDEFSRWIGAGNLKLTINKVGVVARRKTSFRDGDNNDKDDEKTEDKWDEEVDDAVRSEGSIVFSVSVALNGYSFTLFVMFRDTTVTVRLQRDPTSQDKSEFEQLLRWAASALGGKEEPTGQKFEGGSWESCQTWVDSAAELLGAVRPRAIQFALGYDANGKLQGVTGASLALQVELKTKVPDEKSKVVFFLTFGWNKTRKLWMNGNLWSKSKHPSDRYRRALPAWEVYQTLEPTDSAHTMEHVDLKKLFDIDGLPAGIPTEIAELDISLDGTGMTFQTSITCSSDNKVSQVPKIAIENVFLRARRVWANEKKKIKGAWQITFEVSVMLQPAEDARPPVAYIERIGGDAAAPVPPCRLSGGIDYLSGDAQKPASWALTASVDGLTVGHLAQFWPEGEVRRAAMSMLSHFVVEHLGLTYRYGAGEGDGGTDFSIDGRLLLGGIAMDLDFHYDSKGWEFGAILSLKSKSMQAFEEDVITGAPTVKTILSELAGDDSLPLIPGAVLDIPVGKPKGEGEALSFKCTLMKDKNANDVMVFTFSIQISAVSLTVVQWRYTSWDKNVPSKRVVKVALNEVGPVKAPLVGKLKQPFEQLIYMWVSDSASAMITPKTLTKEKKAKEAGVTKNEFDTLSDVLKGDTDKLYFKSNALDADKIKSTEFVIEAGSHFVVTAKNDKGTVVAVLDYVFGRPKKEKDGKDPTTQDDDENKEPAKAPFKQSAGPLSIENIGLTFDMKEKRLGIVLDATFLLGPLGLALVGFGISARLEPPAPKTIGFRSDDDEIEVNRFGSLPVSDPQATLSGLMVSFERPPVTIAGGFARTEMDGSTFFTGGLIVGFNTWKLQAMGIYGEVAKKSPPSALLKRRHRRARSSIYKIIELSDDDDVDDVDFGAQDDSPVQKSDTYTMVFVILKLEGPLFSVGFADVSGLTAGVGVNSAVRLPTAETVFEFPFTKPSGTPPMSNGPLASLRAVLWPPANSTPWFTPREGSFWIAAGLKATAFELLSVDAVIVVTMNPSIQLGIFGVAVIDVPSLASEAKFAHVELGIACVFDPVAGTLRLDAQLSPRSYVLHENCHLTGGMALYSWAQTGDFVLTIGGYHQAFVVPKAYPVPPRLGIAWSLDDKLRISGEAYFAMTPRFCMGGGKLNATLSLGPLSAWFDVFLDFLINFRPFKFAADGGISVGVRYTLDLWLVTIRISAEIGAMLSVLGPPMAGRVHVDFWVFGFDIDFGNRDAALSGNAVHKLTLAKFKALVLKNVGSAATNVPLLDDWADIKHVDDEDAQSQEKTTESFLFNCSGGLLPDNNIPGGSSSEKSGDWVQAMFGNDTEVDKNAWPVSAGELQFSITFSFAANYAKVIDARPKGCPDPLEVPIKDEHKTIFALPMRQRKQLKSEIEVRISQNEKCAMYFRAMDDEGGRKEDEWLVRPIVKNVPRNLWGVYDPVTDPALHGNSVASLLNAPDAVGSVPLVMGLTFQPPIPKLSKDLVPKFNIVKDMLQRVEDKGYKWEGDKGKASTRWSPRKEEEEGKGRNQWTRVKELWDTEETENKAVDVVDLWAKRMCWDISQGAPLAGRRPKALLRRFDNVMPAAPMIAVGV
ncbi:hypothetical protein F5B18DRAFT_618039 [Nemania serpens]|nr:hypothetical protein F5B18DRAFT_618039 [Nemania serpens]